MKKLLSLSLMLSLGLATVTPALNAAQSQQAVAESQANPAHVSGWQAAKKWWRSGRNMKALNRQEQRAFNALKKNFTLGAIITAIVALVGGGAAYRYRRSAGGAANVSARPRFFGDDGGPAFRPAPVVAGHLGEQLRDAASAGNEPEVERLITAGADVNAVDQYGHTALMKAATMGHENHENIVKMLLQVDGIDVNATNHEGDTALIFAARWGNENIVEKLLQVDGIDVNAAGVYGYTALIWAARRGYENIVKMLLDAGADRTIQTRHNQTAEAMARENDREDLANMIRDWKQKA